MSIEPEFAKTPLRLLPTGRGQSRVTMILGMHRSGTSFLTGSLQQAGLELGRHSSWNPHNTRGNRENEEIVALHDAVLRRCGFSWDKPPKDATILEWTDQERTRAQGIVDGYRRASHWGFKDPRSLLFVDGWQALLPHVGFVGVFRHPMAVARSLKRRGRIPIRYGLGLWLIYNTRLLQLHERSPFPVLNFDDPPELLLDKLDRVATSLNLRARSAERFYCDELRHHRAEEDVTQPETVTATLQALQRIAL